MGAEVSSLVLKVTAEGAILTAEQLRQLSGSAKGAEDSFGKLAGRIAGFTTAADLAVRAGQAVLRGVKDLAVESVTLAASFEKSRMTWGVLVGDMAKGGKVFEDIYDFASRTPLSFEGLNQAATTIKGFGVATEDLIPTLSKLGDVAMGDNNKLQALALVYGQTMAQGKAKTQDLYQFINAGVPIFQMLADSMGRSSGEIKTLAADGAITFEEIEKALTKATSAGGQFYGMMEKTAESALVKWSTAQDNFKGQLAALGESVLPLVTAALDAANKEMERWNRNRAAAAGAVQAVSITNLASKGDIAGIRSFFQGLSGVSPDDVQGWIDEARKANPLANSGQAAALRAAEQELLQYRVKLGQPATSGSASPIIGAPATSLANPWTIEGDRYNAAYASYMRGGTQPYGELFQSDDLIEGADAMARMREEGDRSVASFQALVELWGEQEERARRLAEALDQIDEAFSRAGQSLFIESFKSLGEALVTGADAGESFAMAMASVGEQLLDSLPQLFLAAGLQAMIAGNWPLGLALVAAAGGTAFASGVVDGAKEANALGGVYSSPSLSAYSGGVYHSPQYFGFEGSRMAFAKGGVFAEAGPEAIMPLSRDGSGRLGVRAQGAGVSIVINNNSSGATASAQETTGPGGEKQIVVTVENIVKSALASGKMDGAMGRYGVRPKGVRN